MLILHHSRLRNKLKLIYFEEITLERSRLGVKPVGITVAEANHSIFVEAPGAL